MPNTSGTQHAVMRLLAIDYGKKRVGLALSDSEGIATTPYGHIARESDEQAAVVVLAVIKQEQVEGLVVGLPLMTQSGEESDAAGWARSFGERIVAASGLPIHYVDERYSSEEAREALAAAGDLEPAAGVVDAKAAAIILRRYLDGES